MQAPDGTGIHPDKAAVLMSMLEYLFIFATVWSVGATTNTEGRVAFDAFLRGAVQSAGTGVHLPPDGTLYDWCYDYTGALGAHALPVDDGQPPEAVRRLLGSVPQLEDSVDSVAAVEAERAVEEHAQVAAALASERWVAWLDTISKPLPCRWLGGLCPAELGWHRRCRRLVNPALGVACPDAGCFLFVWV